VDYMNSVSGRRGSKGRRREALCLANIPFRVLMTDLCGELVQWVGIYGVDSERVVSVNGSETGRDWVLAGILSSFK